MAWAFAPFSLFSARALWSIFGAGSLTVCAALATKLKISLVNSVLLMTSPPVVIAIFYGNIDVLVLGCLLLPEAFWPIMALTKIQLGLGLLLPFDHKWLRNLCVAAGVGLASVLLWGLWPLSVLREPGPGLSMNNYWLYLRPLNLLAGLALLWAGCRRKDWRLNLAAGPFLSSYAQVGNFVGVWLALAQLLPDLVVALIWLAWWATLIHLV